MAKYVIGLDNGGTSTKAAIFDLNGKEIATAGKSTKVITPKSGYTERDMEEYKKNNMAYVAEFKERFQKVEERLDKAEQFVFTLKSVIYRGYRCPYPPQVEDCPIIKAYKGEGCEECDAYSENKQ